MLEQRVAMLEHRLALQPGAVVVQEPWSGKPVAVQPKIQPEVEGEGYDDEEPEETEAPEPQDEDDGYDPELDKKIHPVLSDFKNPLPKSKAPSAMARIVIGGGNGLGGGGRELEMLQSELWEEALGDE